MGGVCAISLRLSRITKATGTYPLAEARRRLMEALPKLKKTWIPLFIATLFTIART